MKEKVVVGMSGGVEFLRGGLSVKRTGIRCDWCHHADLAG